MLDLSLFSHPAILAGMIMAIVTCGALAGVELTLAQELQYVLGKTPLQAGIFMIPIMTALALLAQADFHHPGVWVPALLGMLGLVLSTGLTASSIAIMGSVEASKGGAAGSLEVTGYELGSGLGITFFGVFMSRVFARTLELPPQLLATQATRSIGDAHVVAQQLDADQASALIEAAKVAFSTTHSVLLTTSAVLIGVLAVIVFFMLANYAPKSATHG